MDLAFWHSAIYAAAAGITAWLMLHDAATFRLPNWAVGTLGLLYPFWVLTGTDYATFPWSVLIASLVLVVGMLLFSVRLLGAGDAKFMAAGFLWVGPSQSLWFFFLFALLGGALSLFLLLLRPVLDKRVPARWLPRILRRRQPVAYGLAIGGGLLLVMAYGVPVLV